MGHSIAPWVIKRLAARKGGDKMKKIAVLLPTILFVLSVMACATTPDRHQSFCEQSYTFSTPPWGYDSGHRPASTAERAAPH